MGQAKKRGTYEQRVLAAEAKGEEELRQLQEQWLAKELAMSEEEKIQRINARVLLTSALALGSKSLFYK